MSVDFFELLAWLATVSAAAFWMVRRENLNPVDASIGDLRATMSRELCIQLAEGEMRLRVSGLFQPPDFVVLVVDKQPSRLVIEQARIGWFHWGFVYFLENANASNIWRVRIHAKWPNPPRGKALERHLEEFCKRLEQVEP